MALEIKHLQTSCGDPKVVFEHSGNYMIDGDEFSRLRSENAELKQKLQDQCISCPVKMQEDDVVADLKRKLESVIAEKDKELRHHKYKRCLGMVRCCMVDNHTLGQVTLNERTNHLQWLFNENFFVKWAARWSKIADKFKEAK